MPNQEIQQTTESKETQTSETQERLSPLFCLTNRGLEILARAKGHYLLAQLYLESALTEIEQAKIHYKAVWRGKNALSVLQIPDMAIAKLRDLIEDIRRNQTREHWGTRALSPTQLLEAQELDEPTGEAETDATEI